MEEKALNYTVVPTTPTAPQQETETPTESQSVDQKEVLLPTDQENESQEMYSKRFSALNKERKAIEQSKLEAKRIQAQIESEKKQIETDKKELEEWRASQSKLKEKELADKDPMDRMRIEIEELRSQLQAEQEEKLKAKQELLKEESNKTVQSAIATIRKTLESNPVYDALLVYGAEGRIYQIIEEQYNSTGEVLQVDDVAKLMMKEVEEQFEKLTKTNIFKTKYANSIKESPKTEQKTLSSALSSATSVSKKDEPLTDAERYRRAMAAVK